MAKIKKTTDVNKLQDDSAKDITGYLSDNNNRWQKNEFALKWESGQ